MNLINFKYNFVLQYSDVISVFINKKFFCYFKTKFVYLLWFELQQQEIFWCGRIKSFNLLWIIFFYLIWLLTFRKMKAFSSYLFVWKYLGIRDDFNFLFFSKYGWVVLCLLLILTKNSTHFFLFILIDKSFYIYLNYWHIF